MSNPTDHPAKEARGGSPATTGSAHGETFSDSQVEDAIKSFLEFGEQQYLKSQQGYFSGPGWAARCLRFHLAQLKTREPNADLSDHRREKP